MRLYASLWLTPEENNGLYYLETVDVTSNLRFGTQLHGGFAGCVFNVDGPKDKTYYRFRMFLGAHVAIFDIYGRRVYEGFVSNTAITENGVEATATGYYAKASNFFFDMIYPYIEATTNLVTNPSFETDVTTSWTLDGKNGGAVQRLTSDKMFGTACAKVIQPNSDGNLLYHVTLAVQPSAKYALSLYAKQVSLEQTPYLRIYENSGVETKGEIFGLDNSWRRYVVTVETNPNTTSVTFGIGVAQKDAESGQGSFLIDGVMVEQKGYATEYCEGSRPEFSSTVYDVVHDCIEMIPEWQHKYAFIAQSDYTVGPQDFTDKKVREALESILKFGFQEADIRPVYFAIWDFRTPYLFPEPLPGSYPNWFVSVANLNGGRAGIALSLDEVYNRIWAVYDDQGQGPSKTATPAENFLSQQRYGIREGLVQNGSLPVSLYKANDFQDMALERYKYPRQVYTIEVSGFIRHSAGFIDYPYRIRSGDQVLLYDLDLVTVHNGTLAGQAAHGLSGFVVKTEYDAGSNTTKIDFGSSDVSFEILMSRLGLSGGLS